MLTKNLLKNRCRSGKVHPQFIKIENEGALKLAESLCGIFNSGTEKSLLEIEDELSQLPEISSPLYPALKKLLTDRCEWGDDDKEVEETRWELVKNAKALRESKSFDSLAAFQKELSDSVDSDVVSLSEGLYADLPEYKKLTQFKPIEPVDLIHRYNCAQIQGLLLNSKTVTLTIKKADLGVKRTLFRWIKFHQLLIEVDESDSKSENLVFKMSGPISIFSNANTYGLKLANFFPRILHLKNWEISADVLVKKKVCKLVVDHKVKIKSHYKEQHAYVPKEFELFIEGFNKKSKDWKSEVGNDFYHIGKQSYSFPDVCFKGPKGKKVYLELFHKWHIGQIEQRLKTVEDMSKNQMIIGVCRSSAKTKDVDKILNNSSWFKDNGFLFSDFPTHSSVIKLLGRF